MPEKLLQSEEWQKLFKAAIRVKEITPWEWMSEQDIFAVQIPDTEQHGYVSVMGKDGEHYAISVYLGEIGLQGFWELQQSGPDISPEKVVETPKLQVSFVDPDLLQLEDQEITEQLGYKFSGRQAWPMFRSCRPGFLPWYLEADEVRFLRYVLEQTIDVSLRFKEDQSILLSADKTQYLLRVPTLGKDKLIWHDSTKKISPPESSSISYSINNKALEALKSLVTCKCTFEMDLFMSSKSVEEKGPRPFYPYHLMLVNAANGMILGKERMQPIPSLEAMRASVPITVAEWLKTMHLLPEKIVIGSAVLYELLTGLSNALGFLLEHSKKLPNLDRADAE